jgi:hypothetical protein
MTSRRWAAVVALALALGAGGACGGGGGIGPPTTLRSGSSGGGVTTSLPAGDVEGIQANLVEEQKKRFPTLTVGEAACPAGAPEPTAGSAVTCTVTMEGVAVPFQVTYLGALAETEGGGESYEFRASEPIIVVETIVSDIRRQAADQLRVAPDRVTVDCGTAKVQVLGVGEGLSCTVNDGRTTRRLAAVVADETGSISINEVPAGP